MEIDYKEVLELVGDIKYIFEEMNERSEEESETKSNYLLYCIEKIDCTFSLMVSKIEAFVEYHTLPWVGGIGEEPPTERIVGHGDDPELAFRDLFEKTRDKFAPETKQIKPPCK